MQYQGVTNMPKTNSATPTVLFTCQVCVHTRHANIAADSTHSTTHQLEQRGLTSKEEEDTPLHAAKHGDEALANDEGEEHVHGHVEGASRCTHLQRLDLTAHVHTQSDLDNSVTAKLGRSVMLLIF